MREMDEEVAKLAQNTEDEDDSDDGDDCGNNTPNSNAIAYLKSIALNFF